MEQLEGEDGKYSLQSEYSSILILIIDTYITIISFSQVLVDVISVIRILSYIIVFDQKVFVKDYDCEDWRFPDYNDLIATLLEHMA
jgi:hypothetical protein